MRVVLVDDHVSLREMLRVILGMEGGYEIVGETASGLETLKLCRATKPALVILDLSLPELSGTHLVRLLLREPWDVRGYAVTSYASQGKSVNHVLFSDSAVKAVTNNQQWYVTISRGQCFSLP